MSKYRNTGNVDTYGGGKGVKRGNTRNALDPQLLFLHSNSLFTGERETAPAAVANASDASLLTASN